MTPTATTIRSQIKYEFIFETDEMGVSLPSEIGTGAFARVLKAWQRTDENRVRRVAIKILRDDATLNHERLFEQEIRLVKELNATGSVNVVTALDIIELPPLVLCGSGRMYSPHCPQCGQGPLKRLDPEGEEHPCLACDACSMPPISPRHRDEVRKLFHARAKPFAIEGPLADQGTVVNFVHRKALVMELLESKLPEYLTRRHRDLIDEWRHRGVDLSLYDDDGAHGSRVMQPPRKPAGWTHRLTHWWRPDAPEVLVPKAMLLEKLLMMVQLAEAVAWLHHDERQIVHKDLAPDNVMVHSLGGLDAAWRASADLSLQACLDEMVTYPTVAARVIDFGLADQGKLTRSWYEEETPIGQNKSPYMSPEAEKRPNKLNQMLAFDRTEPRFRLIALKDIREGDIIADGRYPNHEHDIIVNRIEMATDQQDAYAYYEGTPDPTGEPRYVHIPMLGEAHDIFSLGTLFYFILTDGDADEVRALRQAAGTIEGEAADLPLTVNYLKAQTGYARRRGAIREPFYRDDLMLLILRMMIRGARNSFLSSRTQRGSEAAQQVLHAVKHIHHQLMQDVLSSVPVGRSRRTTTTLLLLGIAGLAALMLLLGP